MSHREKHMQGLQLCQEGQAQEALNLLGQALNEKETSERWNDWAVVQFSCDCVPEAERGFRRALELDPQNTQAGLNLGILLAGLKQYSEAIPFLEDCTHGINNAQRAAVTQILAACRAKQAESGKDTHDHLPSTSVRPATGPRLSLTEEFDPSSQIQGTRRKRIVFTGDLLRIESDFDQVANIRSLYNLLNYSVSLAVKDATIEMVLRGSQRNAINRSRIYELNGLSETLEGCLTLTGAREISESSAALLKTPFAEAVVFGLEMPDFLLRVLNHCGIPYLYFIIHPVRFLDDIFFGIRTNIPDAFTALKTFACNEEVFRLQAQIHKATLQRQGLPQVEENACLFVEPQRGSPWLVEDGQPHGVVDFADEIQRIAGQYDTIYFRPHPYFRTTEKSTLDTLHRAGRVVIPDCNLYSLFAHDNIKEVIGVASSVLYEAQYFGKKVTHLLKKKRFKFYGRENTAFDPWTYVAIYDAFYNPQFWAEVLKSVCEVRDCPEINLPRKASRLRTSFQTFWNYNQLDAVVLLKHLKATSEFDFCNHDLQQQQLTAGRSPAINGDALKEVLNTLTQHAKAIQLITELVRALQSQLDEMAGHTPAEPNQTSARPVPLS